MADLEKFKLSSLHWEGDKNEDGFFVFQENFGNMVRSTTNGFHLEETLGSKLRRAPIAHLIMCQLMKAADGKSTLH